MATTFFSLKVYKIIKKNTHVYVLYHIFETQRNLSKPFDCKLHRNKNEYFVMSVTDIE